MRVVRVTDSETVLATQRRYYAGVNLTWSILLTSRNSQFESNAWNGSNPYREGRMEAIADRANDRKVYTAIITVLATLIVGAITLVAYLWYLTPSPDHKK